MNLSASVDAAESKWRQRHGTRAPGAVGFTTVRIELFVDDPVRVQRRALAAGSVEHSPVTEEQFEMKGPKPIKRILQGAITDPFGHLWPIGRIVEWPRVGTEYIPPRTKRRKTGRVAPFRTNQSSCA